MLHITIVQVSKHNLGQDKTKHAQDGNQSLKVNRAAIAFPVAIPGGFFPGWPIIFRRGWYTLFRGAPFGGFGNGALRGRVVYGAV